MITICQSSAIVKVSFLARKADAVQMKNGATLAQKFLSLFFLNKSCSFNYKEILSL